MWEHDRCVNHFRVDQLQNFEIRFKGVANQDCLGGELAKQHGLHVAQFCCNSAKKMGIFFMFLYLDVKRRSMIITTISFDVIKVPDRDQ